MRPPYACVILRAPDGRFLLESRPPDARHAASQWTCFGGRREPGESPAACAERELAEELGAGPLALAPGVDLYVAGEHVAHFFVARDPVDPATLRTEPGRGLELLAADALDGAPLSSWHRAVLRAFLAGRTHVGL